MYKLNFELTKQLYNDKEIKKIIEPKACYYNQFQVCCFSKLREKYKTGEYKVALVYVNVALGIWIRHCVTITNKNEIIDLTLMAGSGDSNREYEVVKIFEYEEYQKQIDQAYDKKNDNYRCDFPDLKEEFDFYKNRKGKEEYYQINEYDFFEYIVPLLKKYEKIS